jgi:SAM-dependent methyltransferase
VIDGARQFWDQVDDARWAETFPPWRPNVREREQLAELIRSHRGGRAALMGSTPELRDLLWAAKLPTDVVEQSASMYRVMATRCRDTSLETFRESDWLAWFRACPDQSYDLILGDLVIRILPDEVVAPLFEQLHRALAPGGRLCLRMHIVDGPRSQIDVAELVTRYSRLRLFDEWIVDRLFFSLSEHFHDDDGRVDVDAMTRALVEAAPERGLVELFVAKWSTTPLSYHVRSEARLRALAGSLFVPRVLASQYPLPDTLHVVEWTPA